MAIVMTLHFMDGLEEADSYENEKIETIELGEGFTYALGRVNDGGDKYIYVITIPNKILIGRTMSSHKSVSGITGLGSSRAKIDYFEPMLKTNMIRNRWHLTIEISEKGHIAVNDGGSKFGSYVIHTVKGVLGIGKKEEQIFLNHSNKSKKLVLGKNAKIYLGVGKSETEARNRVHSNLAPYITFAKK